MSTYSGRLAAARHLYRAAAELGKAAQLLVFNLGCGTFIYLGVLLRVFRVTCTVYVLVMSRLEASMDRECGEGPEQWSVSEFSVLEGQTLLFRVSSRTRP